MAETPIDEAPRPLKVPSTGSGAVIVEAILDAASELIVQGGYEHTTTNAVAKRAGISIGSLYQYFGDKHAIVAEIARRRERRGLEAARRRAAGSEGRDAKTVTSTWVDAALDPLHGDPALRRALLLEVPPIWVLDAKRGVDGGVERALVSVMRSLGDGLRAGDTELMAFVVHHAVEGVVEAVLRRRPAQLDDPRFHGELLRLAWHYAAPPGADLTPAPMPSRPRTLAEPRPTEPAPPPPAPKTKRARRTVERIVEATARVLTTEGYEGLKARRIADEAGLSPGAMYRHFPNVPAIVRELARRRETRTLERTSEALTEVAGAPLRETIEHVVRTVCGPIQGPPELRRALLTHVPHRWFADTRASITEGLRTALEPALFTRADEIRQGDIEWMGFLTAHAVSATVEAAVLQRPELLPEPLAAELSELVFRFLRR